jgi:8-oxo-dGTP pyrophosphatase MutT (NUDIX family)
LPLNFTLGDDPRRDLGFPAFYNSHRGDGFLGSHPGSEALRRWHLTGVALAILRNFLVLKKRRPDVIKVQGVLVGKARVRTSVVCLHQDKILAFHAEDPISKKKYVFLPGGAIEPDETAPEAAIRETLEETGFQVELSTADSIDKEYVFHWKGEDFDCLTIFYRGYLKSPFQAPVNDADYNKGVAWIPRSEINSAFSYSTEILEAIAELLMQAPNGRA